MPAHSNGYTHPHHVVGLTTHSNNKQVTKTLLAQSFPMFIILLLFTVSLSVYMTHLSLCYLAIKILTTIEIKQAHRISKASDPLMNLFSQSPSRNGVHELRHLLCSVSCQQLPKFVAYLSRGLVQQCSTLSRTHAYWIHESELLEFLRFVLLWACVHARL